MQIDMRALELLASKLCHDIISPVGAINNGVELIEDIGGDVIDEAMKLIAASAGVAARRLRLFRIAYGRAGSEANLDVNDVRQVAAQQFVDGKIVFNWPENAKNHPFFGSKGGLKTLLNLVILGEELLPYGGTLTVRAPEDDSPMVCVLEVSGRNAHLSPALQAALVMETPVEEITPRSVQAYVTGAFAANFSLKIEPLQQSDTLLIFSLRSAA